MNFLKTFIVLFSVVLSMIIVNSIVEAEGANYEITALPSKFQYNKNVTYYDLSMPSATKEVLKVKMENTSSQEIVLDIDVDKATTNINGVVEYKNSNKNKSKNMDYDIRELVNIKESKITLAVGESKIIDIEITSPKKEFNGVIAGGINVVEKASSDEKDGGGSMAIKNQYGYTIAMILHGKNEKNTNNVTSSKPTLEKINGRINFIMPIENNSPQFLNKVEVTGDIYDVKDSGKPVYTVSKTNAQMAPNSVYNFPISTKEEAMKTGKYKVVLKVTSKKQQWEFKEMITVSNDLKEKINEHAVIKEHKWSTLSILLVVLIPSIVLVLLLLFFIIKLKKNILN